MAVSYTYKEYPSINSISDQVSALDDIFVNILEFTKIEEETIGSDVKLNYDFVFDAGLVYAQGNLEIYIDDANASYKYFKQTLHYNYDTVSNTAQFSSSQVTTNRRMHVTSETIKAHIFNSDQFKGVKILQVNNSSYEELLGVFRPLGWKNSYYETEDTKSRLYVSNYLFTQLYHLLGSVDATQGLYTNHFIDLTSYSNVIGINLNLKEGITAVAGANVSNIKDDCQQFDSNLRYGIKGDIGAQATVNGVLYYCIENNNRGIWLA